LKREMQRSLIFKYWKTQEKLCLLILKY